MKNVITVLVSLGLLVFSFLAGVDFEFKNTISKSIPYYTDYYQREAEMDKIEDFVTRSKQAISHWKTYNVATSQIGAKDKSRTIATQTMPIYRELELDLVNTIWKIRAKYYYSYILLICADIEGSEKCLTELQDVITEINELFKQDMSVADRKWLDRVGLRGYVALRNAQYKALILRTDPFSKDKLDAAKKAMKEYVSLGDPVKEGIPNDRLLGRIYHLAMGTTIEGYVIPE